MGDVEPRPPLQIQPEEKDQISIPSKFQENKLLPTLAKKTMNQSLYNKKLPEHAKVKKVAPKFKYLENYMLEQLARR